MLNLNQSRDTESPTSSLSRADAIEYMRLKESFIHSQSSRTRDRRGNTFKQEIETIIRFVDSRQEDRELRALATGLIRNGSYLCVNSQRLKLFVRRCKSSINNGFQQLGFESVKSRSCSNACLTSALPSIASQTNLGRQWTVRCIEKPVSSNGTTQATLPISQEAPPPSIPASHALGSPPKSGNSTFQHQLLLERPKSAAPFVRSLLPIPILTSKSPLPIPKIIGQNSSSINTINSFSSIPVQQNAPPITPFLVDIPPPEQEDTFNEFTTQSNDVFSSWDLNIETLDNSTSTSTESSLNGAVASSSNSSSFSSEMSGQDSVFSFDQTSADLHPFDDMAFKLFCFE